MDVADANSLYTLKVIALIFIGCPALMLTGAFLLWPEIWVASHIYSEINKRLQKVIRCKDCRYRNEEGCPLKGNCTDYDFCSKGEEIPLKQYGTAYENEEDNA